MRTFFTIAAVTLAATLVGCNNNKTASPGATGDAACCGSCTSSAAPGAVSAEKSNCASSCASSCSKTAAPGAVSADKADCASSCATSCKMSTAAPGAVKSKSNCASSCNMSTAAPGAVKSKATGCPFSGAGCDKN